MRISKGMPPRLAQSVWQNKKGWLWAIPREIFKHHLCLRRSAGGSAAAGAVVVRTLAGTHFFPLGKLIRREQRLHLADGVFMDGFHFGLFIFRGKTAVSVQGFHFFHGALHDGLELRLLILGQIEDLGEIRMTVLADGGRRIGVILGWRCAGREQATGHDCDPRECFIQFHSFVVLSGVNRRCLARRIK